MSVLHGIIIAAASLTISGSAFAQSNATGSGGAFGIGIEGTVSDGPIVGGDVDIDVNVGDVSQTVIGNENVAGTDIGTVSDGVIDGDVNIDVNAGDVSNTVIGNKNCGEVRIGAVGSSRCKPK